MASRSKPGSGTLDIEALANIIAEKLLDKLGQIQYSSKQRDQEFTDSQSIKIDESIIPIAVDISVDKVNMSGMAKEEKQEDKSLASSKSKLISLLKSKETK